MYWTGFIDISYRIHVMCMQIALYCFIGCRQHGMALLLQCHSSNIYSERNICYHQYRTTKNTKATMCTFSVVMLTRQGRVMHIWDSKLHPHWFRQWLAPSHYLNQCWNIVNRTFGSKLQGNLNRNWYVVIHENTFENVVWKMAAILSRSQCVKALFSLSTEWCCILHYEIH